MNTEVMFTHVNSPDGKTYTLKVNPKWLAQEPDRRKRDKAHKDLANINDNFRRFWLKR